MVATAEASVGVNQPSVKPARMITGVMADAPYMISGIEGGKMGPMTEEAAVTAAEKSSS
ncbi:Uncharacterised protein [uncultured Clostridium sp.]|nr:Uncharacterised protein [uncultured Clostridium sp.]